MKQGQCVFLVAFCFLTIINIRLTYIHQNKPPINKFLKEITFGRDTVNDNYIVAEKMDTVLVTPINDEKYPYITKERNVRFSEGLNGDKVEIYWQLWCDGEIIETASYPFPLVYPKDVKAEEEKIKRYASKRIKIYTGIKH